MADLDRFTGDVDEQDFAVDEMDEQSAGDDGSQAAGKDLSDFPLDVDDDDQGFDEPRGNSKSSGKSQGWIKGRINAGIKKGMEQERAALEQTFNTRLNSAIEQALQPFMQRFDAMNERNVEQQAAQLVASGKIPDLETAKKYARMEAGIPEKSQQQPGQQQQQQQRSPDTRQQVATNRSQMLAAQAEGLEKLGYPVMDAFRNNPAVRAKVLSGEWDMLAVAQNLGGAKRRTPTPIRTANGGRTPKSTVREMSDEAFERLEKNLENGESYRVGR